MTGKAEFGLEREALILLAKQSASAAGLSPGLVCALCEQESGWDQLAIRSESLFYQTYVHPRYPGDFGRAISWGLMQIMGETAREQGFTSGFGALLGASTNLQVGCSFFADKVKAAAGSTEKALQLWNGGGNPHYAEEVVARIKRYA